MAVRKPSVVIRGCPAMVNCLACSLMHQLTPFSRCFSVLSDRSLS
ncbi:MAG: hypothetical protein AB2L14_13690 [Candidatus Xenobiia bacterium LiM19]